MCRCRSNHISIVCLKRKENLIQHKALSPVGNTNTHTTYFKQQLYVSFMRARLCAVSVYCIPACVLEMDVHFYIVILGTGSFNGQ